VVCDIDGITVLHLRHALTWAGAEVVGEARTLDEVLQIVTLKRPDIALIAEHPQEDLDDKAIQALGSNLHTCLVILTVLPEESQDFTAMDAAGTVLKPFTGDKLVSAILEAWKQQKTQVRSQPVHHAVVNARYTQSSRHPRHDDRQCQIEDTVDSIANR